MASQSEKQASALPVVQLTFAKGDLIIKQGDYGLSIYQIVEGRVGVFVDSDGEERRVATLAAGEIFGEMAFIAGINMRRSATIRALERTQMEVWHPSRVAQEYEAMPAILRHISSELTKQLVGYNRMARELTRLRRKKAQPAVPAPDPRLKRRAYRKDVSIDCMYRPVGLSDNTRLWGRISNISRSGMRMDIRRVNTISYPHKPKSCFVGSTFLPNGKRLDFEVKLANLRAHADPKRFELGVQFTRLMGSGESDLGFFLLAK